MQSEDSYHGSLRETEEEFRLTIDSCEMPPRLIYSFKNNNYFNDIALLSKKQPSPRFIFVRKKQAMYVGLFWKKSHRCKKKDFLSLCIILGKSYLFPFNQSKKHPFHK